MNKIVSTTLSLLVSSALLSACVSSHNIAPSLAPMQIATSATRALDPAQLPSERWWQALQDPALDQLVEQALRDNPSIAIASLRLQRANLIIDAADAAYGPAVVLNANPSQQRFAEHHTAPKPLAGSVRTNNRLALDFSAELDFWGKQRAAHQSGVAQSRLAQAELAAARLSLSSHLVRAWGELNRLTQQQTVLKRQLDTRRETLALQALREKVGFETGVERAQTEATMATLRSELHSLEERALTQRHLLATLAGLPPEQGESLPAPRLALFPTARPPALTASLLARRPEVAAARWRVEAATQDAAVTKTAFYPNVNLSGFIGLQALGLDKWLELSARTHAVGPVLSLPIFDAERLRTNYRLKTTDIDTAVAQYNQTLIDGLRDIVDCLTLVQGSDAQLSEQTTARNKTQEAAELLAKRERKGLGNHIPVLNATLQVLNVERTVIDLEARRFDARIQLIRAVGGDGSTALDALLPTTAPIAAR